MESRLFPCADSRCSVVHSSRTNYRGKASLVIEKHNRVRSLWQPSQCHVVRHKRTAIQTRQWQVCSVKNTFQGQFGTWTVEDEDRREVFLYRLGLSVSASAFTACAGLTLVDHAATVDWLQNLTYFAGCTGFGLSLIMIHIYMKPVKNLLQALFCLGALGSVYLLMRDECSSVPQYIVEHPYSVWLIGPLFASLTGVSFKEGVCYGKREAFILFGLTPILLLTHLSTLVEPKVESALLILWSATFASFAFGKWSQKVHEDIGDKSVFEFLALPEEQQKQMMAEIENKENIE